MTRKAGRREALSAADRRYVWHPFTPMADWMSREPLIVESGEREMLRDMDGAEYIDGTASLWCAAFGHRRPEIDRAVRDQLDRVAHSTLLGLASPPSVELAEKLARMAPDGLEKVFYSDDGSTAAEVALKMAFHYWSQNGQPRRRRFLSLQNGYHGDSLGAVSAGGIGLFHETYRPLLFQVGHLPSPYCYRCPFGLSRESCGMKCLAEARRQIRDAAPDLAAVIVEPMVQGAAGMIMMPAGFLKGIETACREAGAFLIADEVATGFGRTGRMFACEWEDVRPDFMTVGKALTGGYLPVAATLTTQEVFDGFLGEGRAFYHGHTFTGNALGCAAANAAMRVLAKEDIPRSLGPRIALLREGLARLAELPHVGEARNLGMMTGVELVRDKETREPFAPSLRAGAEVCGAMRPKGVVLRPLGDVLIIMPPLTIEPENLARLMDAVFEATAEVTPRLAGAKP